MKFERDYQREGLRGKDSTPFEWWSVSLNTISLHVHNNTSSGEWTFKVNSTGERSSSKTYKTKREAMKACCEAAVRLLDQDTEKVKKFLSSC